MEWIKTILPIIGVLIGWLLSESGKVFTDKRQDKRKLKKLLYFLLELRYRFAKELSYELDLDKCINLIKSKLADKFGIDRNDPELNIGMDNWKPFFQNLISKTKQPDDKFEYLAENIDKILIELAEVSPILAYELSGRHNIKERLNRANNYFGEVEALVTEIPFDIKKFINPKLTKDLLEELDESIEKIAKQIDKQTLQISKEKVLKMNFEEEDGDAEKLVDEYFVEVTKQLT